jgi:molybdopterin-guanine dinucleotide biosynthesis adapter protein
MRVIGLTGWSGAGKTTLILKIIPALKQRGFSVSTLKHAHHNFDVDVKGKDSYAHREAGAQEVLVASKNRYALMREWRGMDEPPLKELLTKLSPVDFVLVEGFKHEAHKKIALHRVANLKPPVWEGLSHIVAQVSDAQEANVIALDDVPAIVGVIMREAEPLETLLARLA